MTARRLDPAEELRPEPPFGVQGTNENIWRVAVAERWSDGVLIGHRTFGARIYAETANLRDLEGLAAVCSDCTAQVAQRH